MNGNIYVVQYAKVYIDCIMNFCLPPNDMLGPGWLNALGSWIT